MIVTFIIIGICALVTGALLVYARFGTSTVNSSDEFSRLVRPVDMQAFGNLIDPSQVNYLKSRLPAEDFARLERKRSFVLAEYVRRIAHNAGVMVGYAHYLSHRETESSELLSLAVRVRMYSFWVMVLLYLKVLLPWTSTPVPKLLTFYEAAMRAIPRTAEARQIS